MTELIRQILSADRPSFETGWREGYRSGFDAGWTVGFSRGRGELEEHRRAATHRAANITAAGTFAALTEQRRRPGGRAWEQHRARLGEAYLGGPVNFWTGRHDDRGDAG